MASLLEVVDNLQVDRCSIVFQPGAFACCFSAFQGIRRGGLMMRLSVFLRLASCEWLMQFVIVPQPRLVLLAVTIYNRMNRKSSFFWFSLVVCRSS